LQPEATTACGNARLWVVAGVVVVGSGGGDTIQPLVGGSVVVTGEPMMVEVAGCSTRKCRCCRSCKANTKTPESATTPIRVAARSHRFEEPAAPALLPRGSAAGDAGLRLAGARVVGAVLEAAPGITCSASARARSAHRGNRSLGSLASATASTGSSAASSGWVSANAGGVALRW
jgi:hypothetical protein